MDKTKTNLGYNMFFLGYGASRIKSIKFVTSYGEKLVEVVYHPESPRTHCNYGEEYIREKYGWQRIGCTSRSTRNDGCHIELVGY